MNKITLASLMLGLSLTAAPLAMADSHRDRDYHGDRHDSRHSRQERKQQFRHDRRERHQARDDHKRHFESRRFGSAHDRHRYRDWRHYRQERRHAHKHYRKHFKGHYRGHHQPRGYGWGYYQHRGHGYGRDYRTSGRHHSALPIIAGGVIGGLVGSDLGHGDPGAATRGLVVGSVLGYALTR